MTRHAKATHAGEQLQAVPPAGFARTAKAIRRVAFAPMSGGTPPPDRILEKIRYNSLNRISGEAPASRRPPGKFGFVSGGVPPRPPSHRRKFGLAIVIPMNGNHSRYARKQTMFPKKTLMDFLTIVRHSRLKPGIIFALIPPTKKDGSHEKIREPPRS